MVYVLIHPQLYLLTCSVLISNYSKHALSTAAATNPLSIHASNGKPNVFMEFLIYHGSLDYAYIHSGMYAKLYILCRAAKLD